jgi:hypothetical protein
MLASVLNTARAVDVSVYVVRAFVQLRELVIRNRELAAKLEELDRKVAGHDEAIRSLVQTIRQLMTPPEKPRRSIGFRVEEGKPAYGRLRRVRRRVRMGRSPAGVEPSSRGLRQSKDACCSS